jgi:hypothetical protein
MTGTTAVSLVTSGCVEITAFYLSAPAVGNVILSEDAEGGTTLVSLAPGSTSVRYLHIQLWPTPSAVITYYVDYTRELADLVQDKEEPLLPPDFHHILWKGAVSDEWMLKDDERAALVRQDLEIELRHLNHWLWNVADFRPAPEDTRLKYSRLGGWFSAGT